MKLDTMPMRPEVVLRSEAAAPVGARVEGRVSAQTVEAATVRPVTEPARAVAMLNRALQDAQRDLRFVIDEASGATVVQVIEPGSGEVIRQIPGEEVLRLASLLGAGQGLGSLGLDDWS